MKAVPRPRAFTYFSARMAPIRTRRQRAVKRRDSFTYLLRWTQILVPGLILVVLSVILTGVSFSKKSEAVSIDYQNIREELMRNAGQ